MAAGFQEQAFQAVKVEWHFIQGQPQKSPPPHPVGPNLGWPCDEEGVESGHSGGAHGLDRGVSRLSFRNTTYKRILSLKCLSPSPSQFSQNLMAQPGATREVLCAYSCKHGLHWGPQSGSSGSCTMALQCARLLPLLWATLIREIENNLSAVTFFSRTQSYFYKNFPRLFPHTLMSSTIVFIIFGKYGEFLVWTRSSVSVTSVIAQH